MTRDTLTPEHVELCRRLAAEAARYRWAHELSEDARRSEAEDARKAHRVGYLCDPKASRAWWAAWEPAFQAALVARKTAAPTPDPRGWGGPVHRQHARAVARYARVALDACVTFAARTGEGAPPPLTSMGNHLDAIEAWASSAEVAFIDVSDIVPACVSPVPELPWVIDPLGTMRHLAQLVATSLVDQWAFHQEQALCAAASTMASLDDLRHGATYRAAYVQHRERLTRKVAP